jgi:hypothetical protein
MLRVWRADTAPVSILLPTVGQLARVVAGATSLVAVVDGIDHGAIVLDIHGAALPTGPARLSFNATFGGVLLAGVLRVDDDAARFLPNAKGLRYAQRRETFRVTVDLPAAIEHADLGPFACKTLNLSIGGALLEIERPFAPADRVTVTIVCHGTKAVSLPATVVRGEYGATRLAVAFVNLGRGEERRLSTLVAAAQRRALATR